MFSTASNEEKQAHNVPPIENIPTYLVFSV